MTNDDEGYSPTILQAMETRDCVKDWSACQMLGITLLCGLGLSCYLMPDEFHFFVRKWYPGDTRIVFADACYY